MALQKVNFRRSEDLISLKYTKHQDSTMQQLVFTNTLKSNSKGSQRMSSKNNLDLLNSTIDGIKDVCARILKQEYKIAKYLKSGECDIILDLYENPDDIIRATELLQQHIETNSKTAETVIDEIDAFATRLAKGKLGSGDENVCYTLSQVWFGDYFGTTKGIKSLMALKAELKGDLKALDDEELKNYLEENMKKE